MIVIRHFRQVFETSSCVDQGCRTNMGGLAGILRTMPNAVQCLASTRIMLVITRLGIGGAESQVRDLALAFRIRQHEVVVVSLRRPEAHVEELNKAGVKVYSLGMESPAQLPAALFRYLKLVRKLRPSVVHSHCYHANILCRIARLLMPQVKLVCTAHSTFEVSRKLGQSSKRRRDAAYRWTNRLSHYNTHVSQQGVERYIRDGLFRTDNSEWVANGIAVEGQVQNDLKQRGRDKLGWDMGRFVWLHVGRMSRAKNQRLLLEAFAEVLQREPNAWLAMAGGGELEGELNELVTNLGISSNVELLGMRNDVPLLMSCADSFVLSSDWEGLPIVLLEATVAGLTCVATDVGSVSDVLGKSEWIVPPGEKQQLARAMLAMMSLDIKTRSEMANRLRASSLEKFSMDRIVDTWMRIYKDVLTTCQPNNKS